MNQKSIPRATTARFKYLASLMFIVLLGLLLQGCGGTDEVGLAIGKPAPAFTLPKAAGDTVSLADYQGKQPVLLYFHMAMG